MRANARSGVHRIGRIRYLRKRLAIMSNKDIFLQAMEIQLGEVHTEIDDLEGKTHLNEVMVMTAYQREMRALRSQLRKALLKLEELKTAGETGWDCLKAEMERAFDALTDSLRDFRARN